MEKMTKKLFIGALALWSVPSFAMSFGVFATHCQEQRDLIHSIDRALETGKSTDTTKEAYFDHIMRVISAAEKCSDIDGTLRDILADLPSEKSADERFDKEWEDSKRAVKARNEYYKRIRERASNRFDQEFSKL